LSASPQIDADEDLFEDVATALDRDRDPEDRH
jgi:hypothetical protein